MREATASRVEQLVKQHMPTGAVGYFFQQITADNRVLRFPETGCFKLIAPFQLPVGVPSGTYQVFFLRSLDDIHPLPPKDSECPFPEVAFYFAPSPATHAAPPEDVKPRRRWSVPDEVEQSPELREARVDFRKRRMAMRLKHRELDLTKSKSVTEDLGDAFELNRAYRHELADSAKSMSSVPQRLAEDAVKMMDVFRQMNQMSLDMIAEHRKRLEELANPAPPPPPPWITLFQQFLPVMLQFGATMFASTKFGAGAPPELVKTLSTSLAAMTPVASPPAIPATSVVAPLPGQPHTPQSLPAGPSQPQATTQPPTLPAVPIKLPELPPLADGALTVQDLYYILSAFQRTDSKEAKQVLTQWITLAEQLNPERAAQRRAAEPPATQMPPSQKP